MKTVFALIPLYFAAVGSQIMAAQSEWSHVRDEPRIQVYTRPVVGSPYLEVKVSAMIDASLEQVSAALGDGEGCGDWRAMCESSVVLKALSEQNRFVYLVLDLPWPIADRDMVIHSHAQVDRDAKTVTVKLQSASSEYPLQDYERAETSGEYRIRAINDAQVEFTYTIHSDLGGDLPPDLINPRLVASTYEDVQRLQSLLEQ